MIPDGQRAVASDRRVPAEWEPQACVWLSWPHNLSTWPGRFDRIPEFYVRWVHAIAESTPVRILAAQDVAKDCEKHVAGIDHVDIVDVPTNDCWVRDYGPTFVLSNADQTIHGVHWRYNAWGGKYPPWDLDQAAAAGLCRDRSIPCVVGELCLEGGAMEFDGRGRMITTPDCLMTPSRNPGRSTKQIVDELHRQLGVTEIVWIDGGGLAGDDTDGHIDQIARFIDCENVVVAVSDDPNDDQRKGLQQNYRQLQVWSESTEPRVSVHRLPIPPARHIDGQRVPESYCNFLRLGPERLFVPTFDSAQDEHAVGLLREISGAEVTAIDCSELVWGLGALHCASRDQPGVKGER